MKNRPLPASSTRRALLRQAAAVGGAAMAGSLWSTRVAASTP